MEATRYLNENVPVLWRHIVPATRKSLSEELDDVIARTRQPEIREGLQKLKSQLQPKSASDQT